MSRPCGRWQGLNAAVVGGDGPLTLDVRPSDDPRRPQEDGDEPGAGDHGGGAASSAPGAIGERPGDGHVAVEADDQKISDGRVAHRVVERQPDVAEDWTQRPVAEDWTSS